MIKIIHKNLLTSDCNFIVHQVNCQEKLCKGIALQVAKRFPYVTSCYKEKIKNAKENNISLLGQIQVVLISGKKNQYLVNLFGQDRYGNSKQTDLTAVRRGLLKVRQLAEPYNLSVAIPYYMGCELGVYPIIEDVFGNTNINVEICVY
jgi:O-acetyl-ADP-ribose deacetylase (regulator of RNase III)